MNKRNSILDRILSPNQGDLSEALAQYILSLDFTAQDHARYQELAEKAEQELLTVEEKMELEEFLNANDFLAIVQSKARVSLGNSKSSVA